METKIRITNKDIRGMVDGYKMSWWGGLTYKRVEKLIEFGYLERIKLDTHDTLTVTAKGMFIIEPLLSRS